MGDTSDPDPEALERARGAPATVYAKPLNQGVSLASVPTMHRVLRPRRGARAAPAGSTDAP